MIFKVGADFVAVAEPSKFSCIGSKKEELVDILWAKKDPAVGVWFFDRDLADLMNSKQNDYVCYHKRNQTHQEIEVDQEARAQECILNRFNEKDLLLVE